MSEITAPAAAPTRPAIGLTHKQISTILIGLMAGMFLAALDQTIVSTSIRVIGDDLGGLSLQAWVTTAYLITSTVTTPLYGKLSDIYGRRPLFITAITLFIIGSLACSFSQSMYQLAAFRAFQGLGAGGLFSLALAILADIVPPRERAKYQGYFLAVFGTSSVIGPIVGGFFAGAETILGITGWRWVFLINVPIGLIALAIVMRVLHIPHTRHNHRIDWWGAAALIVGIVPLLVVAEQGRQWGWGSASSAQPDRARCGRGGRLHLGRVPDARRSADPDAAVPQRRVQPGSGHQRAGRHGHVRRAVHVAALPAAGEGRDADRVRPDADPDDDRHHVRLGDLRPADRKDRPLQDLPRDRRRDVDRRRSSCC